MVEFYRLRGVINDDAPKLLGVKWWQGKKYANVLKYMRGDESLKKKIINGKLLKSEGKEKTWRNVLKAITPNKNKQGAGICRCGFG